MSTSRTNRKVIAKETLTILEAGQYQVGNTIVDFQEAQQAAEAGTRHYRPDDFETLEKQCDALERTDNGLKISLTSETTLAAVQRMQTEGLRNIFCVNFASAKNPGGGFLNGSQAQEEAISRASGLYPCLLRAPDYYAVNRAHHSCLYTDHMIYAPDVPVIRDDADVLLPEFFATSILTAPAVNAGAVRRNEPDREDEIETVMRQRIARMLTVAAIHGHRNLVLGAWGCGVFANDPTDMAVWHRDHLESDRFKGLFDNVTFAVPSRVKANYEAFASVFGASC